MMYCTKYKRLLVASQVPLKMDMACMLTHYKMFRQIICHMKKLFSVHSVHRRGTISDVVELQQRYPKNPFLTDGTYLTPLCQHVQLPFIQYTDEIKHVSLILKVLYQLTVFWCRWFTILVY